MFFHDQLIYQQLMSREEQISRLQGNVRELQDESAKKEATLQKMEMDLINVEEMKHKTDDNVRFVFHRDTYFGSS